ncbi:DUF1186 domain-containing protein [Algivirga pacifica]|uniref:SEC-C motif-containing protein n=1 Tax=Algivirga pacifica TaxID=1162670 RepID=A0ABP9DAY8_9BACT
MLKKIAHLKVMNDPNIVNTVVPIPEELRVQLDDLYEEVSKGKQTVINKLNRLIEDYPEVPMLKNFLSKTYFNRGDVTKAYEVTEWIVREHPDYLHGKVNLASIYMQEEKLDKVPMLLGEALDLQELYPQRDVFNINEVLVYYSTVVRYLSIIGDLEQAEECLQILEDTDAESMQYEQAKDWYDQAVVKSSMEMIQRWKEQEINVRMNPLPKSRKQKLPKLNHEELYILYEAGLRDWKQLNIPMLLELPRETLSEDLCTILQDSIDRYLYFKRKVDKEGWDDKSISFPVHALMLMTELADEENIPIIFQFYRQHEDVLEFYLGDLLTEVSWHTVYWIGNQHLQKLKAFVCEPGVYRYAKSMVCESMIQRSYHEKEQKKAIAQHFEEIVQFFNKATLDDNVIDSSFLGSLAVDVMSIGSLSLFEQMKPLFDKGYVDIQVCGSYKSCQRDIKNGISFQKYAIKGVEDAYQDFYGSSKSFEEVQKILQQHYYGETAIKKEKSIESVHKVGRNDPCPCGSGKKYKKCCMNKT